MMRSITGAQLGVQTSLGKLEPQESLFVPVPESFGLNELHFVAKPGNAGFWTSSPTDHISGFAEWCASEGFGARQRQLWHLTPEPDAVLAEVDSYEDLEALHAAYGLTQHLSGTYELHGLDWFAISQDFAGVHLTEEGQWRTRLTQPLNLYGWDFESTCWLRWAFVKVESLGTVVIERRDD